MAEVPEIARPGSWGVVELGGMLVAIRECQGEGETGRYWEIGCTGPWHEEGGLRSHGAKR